MNPYLTELSKLTWAMETRALERFLVQVSRLPVVEMPKAFGRERASQPKFDLRDGVAHISVKGPILKEAPWWAKYFGIHMASTVDLQAAIAEAVENSSVKSIVLDVDSPGGSVSGLHELAEDIAAAADLKPVKAHAEDLMASAAYWIGSQAGQLTAGKTALVGSIGVYTVLDDYSHAFERAGIKTHVISNHELKGAGVAGSRITDAQLADIQREIDGFAKLFVDAVATGRGMSTEQVEQLATGQVWHAEEALALGLIDAVESVAQAHDTASADAGVRANKAPKFWFGVQGTDRYAAAELGTPGRWSAYDPMGVASDPGSTGTKIFATQRRVSAQEDGSMDPKEVEALKQRLAQAEKDRDAALAKEAATDAENQKLKARQEVERAASVESLISKYQSRVSPAMRGKVEKYAEHCDTVAEFEDFLKSLPEVTRPTGVGSVRDEADPNSIDEKQAAANKALGIDADDFSMFSKVKGYDFATGKLILADGKKVAKEQLQ